MKKYLGLFLMAIGVYGQVWTNDLSNPTRYLVYDTNLVVNQRGTILSNGYFKGIIVGGPQNVLTYGATTNGVLDTSAAIQSAINAGDETFIPAGIYLISSTLLIPSNHRLYGTTGTKLTMATNMAAPVIQNSTTNTGNFNIRIENLFIDGNATNQAAGARTVFLYNVTNAVISDVTVTNAYTWWAGGQDPDNSAFTIIQCDTVDVRDCNAYYCNGTGLFAWLSSHINVTGGNYSDHRFTGVDISTSPYSTIRGVHASGNGSSGISLNSQYSIVEGCIAENTSLYSGINIGHDSSTNWSASYSTIVGNVSRSNIQSGIVVQPTTSHFITVVGNSCYGNQGANIVFPAATLGSVVANSGYGGTNEVYSPQLTYQNAPSGNTKSLFQYSIDNVVYVDCDQNGNSYFKSPMGIGTIPVLGAGTMLQLYNTPGSAYLAISAPQTATAGIWFRDGTTNIWSIGRGAYYSYDDFEFNSPLYTPGPVMVLDNVTGQARFVDIIVNQNNTNAMFYADNNGNAYVRNYLGVGGNPSATAAIRAAGAATAAIEIDAGTITDASILHLKANGTNHWGIGRNISGAGGDLNFWSYDLSLSPFTIDNATGDIYATKRTFLGATSTANNLKVSGVSSSPATSGTTQNGIMRLLSAAGSVFDFGVAGLDAWIQSTDASDLSQNYRIAINPRGGYVGIGKTNAAVALDVNGAVTATGQITTGTGITVNAMDGQSGTLDVLVANGTTNRIVFSGGILISNIPNFFP